MANRKSGKRNVRSLSKMGGGTSFGITFPIELIKKLGGKSKQKLTVTLQGKKLIVKDWKK